MRYEDASNSFQGSGPNANDDSDQLPAGAKEAATGNLITGEGTQYGAAGADSAAGGHITSIAGKGGEDSSFAGGKLSVAGEFGKLSVDAEGNYNYMANKGAPENVRDRFTYTLADNQGATDTAALIIELGKTPVAIKTDAQQIVPGPDGVVTLPPGVELSDVMVVGRNLVINMPDGTQLVIVDGAVFVPQLVLDGVQVPATNVAALLIGQEPQPAAGELPPSSGGNFALPPPPLDPGVPLGDLIPPTVRDYIPPEPQEVFDILDEEPEVTIQPVDQAPSVNAVDSVDERGLPTRNGGEPEGTGEGEDGNPSNNSDPSEATSGTIIIDSPDGVDSVTITGADGIAHEIVVGLVVQGEFGTLTITGIVGDDYTYNYVLNDNTSGDDTQDDFTVVLTDDDGDTATATLTIDIIDDVPTARNDVDSVTEGGPEVADGNVLTGSGGADANSTDGVADTVGADDAELTGFSQGNSNGTLGAPFAAQYGTLVLNADGSYTYTLDGDDPAVRALGDGDTLTEVFTYTLEDGDGDVDTATLTITINGTNEAPTIRSDAAVVSEEGLEGVGLPDDTGSDDTTDSATDSGTMVVSDPDGDPVTVSLTTTGLAALGLESNDVPISWALSDGGHTLTGTAGSDTIITITIDDDGNWDVVLSGPVDHDDPNVEDDLSFNVEVIVDDGSETGSGTLTVTIEDDSPVVTAGEVEPTLVADESDFTVNDTKNFGDVFNIQFGGDGGDPDSVEYTLGTPGGDSGLVDTLTGEAVVLSLEGDQVVGRAGAGGPVVFIVSVDADGNVTVDQQRAVVHDDPLDPDEALSPAELADDSLITLTATATDNDGDSDSETINIGKNVVLEDDGPSIERNQNAAPDLVTDDTNTPNDTDSASFAGLFTGAFGADGPKDVDDNDVPDADAIEYSLSINGGDGTDSGLVDVLTGDPILLFVNGDTIEGRVGGALGPVAFTLTVDPDTGEITQEQDRAITHNDPLDPIESGDSAATMAGGLIVLTATITDGDGDTAQATADIGDSFHFEDDGPSAVNDVDTVEGGAGPATGNVITGDDIPGGDSNTTDGNEDDVGADTPGTITKIQSLNILANVDDTADGSGDFTVVGQYGTLTINEDGSYSYTRTDLEAGGVDDVFRYTLTDADGDSVTATLTISIEDNFPDLPNPDLVRLDDDVIPGAGGNLNGPGDDDPDAVPGNVATGQLEGSGGDAPLTYNFTGVNSLPAGFSIDNLASDANTLVIVQDQNGSDVTVLTIELDQGDGSFTVTQNAPILHDPTNPGAGPGQADNFEDNVTLSIGVEVEDADGDTDPATITINVDDDTPTATVVSAAETVSVDETDGIQVDSDDTIAPAVIALFSGVSDPGTDPDMSAPQYGQSTSALVTAAASSYGADGAGTTVFSLAVSAAGVDSGLDTTAGASIFLFKEGDLIVGRVGNASGDAAFAIAINPTTGVVSMVQYMSLDHPTNPNPDEAVSITDGAILAVVTVTDADGDEATNSVGIGDQIQFQDDGPNSEVDAQVNVPTLTLDETRPIGEDGDDGDDAPAGLATVTVGFASNFETVDYGADGPGTTDYSLVLEAEGSGSGMYALQNTDTDDGGDGDGYGQGAEILLFSEADGSITGRTVDGGAVYFTISVNGSGQVTFTQSLNVWHSDTGTDDDSSGLSAAAETLQLQQTVTDGDGDSDSSSIDLSDGVFFIEDDGVEILDFSNAEGENSGSNPSAEGIFDFDIGTDAPNGGNDDIYIDPTSVVISINGVALDPSDIDFAEAPAGEDEHTAEYEFSFTYDTGGGATDTINGTLIFYKDGSVPGHAAGTYEVVLDGPVQGFTITDLNSIDAGDFVGHDAPGQGGGQDEIVVAPFADDLFVQFTGHARPTNASTLLQTEDYEEINPPPAPDGDPNNVFVAGELLTDNVVTMPSVTVSSADAGVNGNTIQTGEVIDFNLYETDPGATLGLTPTASASDMFLVFDNFDPGDDLIVVLKLMDPDTGVFTTKAVVVNQGDYYMLPDAALLDGTIYESIVSDPSFGNNDSLLVIESNDYNTAPGENWVIVGAQVTNNPDGVTGSGINLDRGLGDSGASSGTESFATDTDVSNLKISNIGFVQAETEDQSVTIDFDVTVTDVDGDSETTSLSAQIGDPPAIPLAPFSLMGSSDQEEQLQKSVANSNTLTLATAVAAAGLVEPVAAHGNGNHNGHGQNAELMTFAAAETVERYSVDDSGDAAGSMLAPEASADASAPADTSSSSSDHSSSSNSLDDSPAQAAPESNDAPAADDGGSHSSADAPNPVAPTVAMVSAEALQAAAGENDNAQQGGSVEQIVADAMQDSGADVDAVLANLPGGNGALQAIAHMASPEAAAVSGWHMAGHGAFGAAHDMMMKMDASAGHHDAVQPVQNG